MRTQERYVCTVTHRDRSKQSHSLYLLANQLHAAARSTSITQGPAVHPHQCTTRQPRQGHPIKQPGRRQDDGGTRSGSEASQFSVTTAARPQHLILHVPAASSATAALRSSRSRDGADTRREADWSWPIQRARTFATPEEPALPARPASLRRVPPSTEKRDVPCWRRGCVNADRKMQAVRKRGTETLGRLRHQSTCRGRLRR